MEIKRLFGTKLKEVGDAGTGLVVFATLNVIDKDGDVTLPGAFGEQHAKIVPAHDWAHVPLGKTRIYESGNDALAELKLNLGIEPARDWHSALKFDLAEGTPLQEWSYAYDPLKWSRGEFQGQQVRFLEKLKVHEVSPVVVGAGEGTRTLMVKGARGRKLADQVAGALEELADLLERVRDLKRVREAEGRGISKERREELIQVKGAIDALVPLGLELELLAKGDIACASDEGRKLLGEFLRISSRLPR